jgi:anti-sigma regulatory factor (Ser/Thr protein kinase)
LISGTAKSCACGIRKPEIYFQVQAELSAIEPVVTAIARFASEKLQGNDQTALEVELALQEVLVNAVVHGCKSNPSLTVQCWAAYKDGEGLLIVVSDPGTGFLPESVPDPLQKENLSFDHGRGVFLIRELMTEVHFCRQGSEVHMLKKQTTHL